MRGQALRARVLRAAQRREVSALFTRMARARAMRGLTATSETRTAMMESLKRQAFADGTLDLASASEGEGEGRRKTRKETATGTASGAC